MNTLIVSAWRSSATISVGYPNPVKVTDVERGEVIMTSYHYHVD